MEERPHTDTQILQIDLTDRAVSAERQFFKQNQIFRNSYDIDPKISKIIEPVDSFSLNPKKSEVANTEDVSAWWYNL